MVKEYNRRRRVLVDGFRKLGFECFEPLGAFYVFHVLSLQDFHLKNSVKSFFKRKILTVPGNAFGECGKDLLELYASSMENIYEALRRIERFVKEELC